MPFWLRDAHFESTSIRLTSPKTRKPDQSIQLYPICPKGIPEHRGGYHKSSRTRDESQRIAGQAYSRAYNTPFKSSRLQGIPIGHTVPFHSSATVQPTSRLHGILHSSHDPDRLRGLLSNPITQPTTFRRSIQRGFRLRGVQPLSHA